MNNRTGWVIPHFYEQDSETSSCMLIGRWLLPNIRSVQNPSCLFGRVWWVSKPKKPEKAPIWRTIPPPIVSLPQWWLHHQTSIPKTPRRTNDHHGQNILKPTCHTASSAITMGIISDNCCICMHGAMNSKSSLRSSSKKISGFKVSTLLRTASGIAPSMFQNKRDRLWGSILSKSQSVSQDYKMDAMNLVVNVYEGQ